MRFIVDENISPIIANALRESGHDVIEATKVCPGVTDTAVIQIALSEARLVITEDKDFGALAFAHRIVPPGLLRIAMHGFDPSAKARRVILVLASDEVAFGHSVVIEPAQVRSRILPSS